MDHCKDPLGPGAQRSGALSHYHVLCLNGEMGIKTAVARSAVGSPIH